MKNPEIVESLFARIEIDRDSQIVKLIRTAEPLLAESIGRAVDDFQLAVPLRERPRLVLLQDMRLAPAVRDEALEKAFALALPRLTAKFAARAVLLATAVGRLQATRFARMSDGDSMVFTDEAEALRFLRDEALKLKPAKP